MSNVSLSAANADYLKAKVDAGCFSSIEEALNACLEEQRTWDDMVRRNVEAGLADLEAGRYTDYDECSLRVYFDGLIEEIPVPVVPPG